MFESFTVCNRMPFLSFQNEQILIFPKFSQLLQFSIDFYFKRHYISKEIKQNFVKKKHISFVTLLNIVNSKIELQKKVANNADSI